MGDWKRKRREIADRDLGECPVCEEEPVADSPDHPSNLHGVSNARFREGDE